MCNSVYDKFFIFLVSSVVIYVGAFWYKVSYRIPDMPKFDETRWWGIGESLENESTEVLPFEIPYDENVIKDLKYRLAHRRPITPSLSGAYSTYGIHSKFLQDILDRWTLSYDFKARIENMNALPHYVTNIQGLDIHFVRVKPQEVPSRVRVLPLLMLHGWPSSSHEFHKVIPILTSAKEADDTVFEVVAPDLPGFGFSQGTTKMGLNPAQMAIIMRNLMRRLGFEQFYVQGGDWGSQVAAHMSTVFPETVLGLHTNMPLSSKISSLRKFFYWYMFPLFYGDWDQLYRVAPLQDYFSYLIRETGYFHIQATKPDTVGVALSDSPAGLAAYIIEKVAVTTNRDQLHTYHGGFYGFSTEDVLDMITICWIGQSITTSMRIYAEGMDTTNEIPILHEIPTEVPTAVLNFRYEVLYQPNCVLRVKYVNIVHTSNMNHGGHFAALENPEDFAADVRISARYQISFNKERRRNILREL